MSTISSVIAGRPASRGASVDPASPFPTTPLTLPDALHDDAARRLDAPVPTPAGVVHHVAFSRDGARALSTDEDGLVRLWDVRHCAPDGVCTGHTGPVRWAWFCRGGRAVVSGAADSTLRLWDARTGEERERVHLPAPLHVAAISPDGTHLAATSPRGEHLLLFDLASPSSPPVPLPHAGDGQILSLAFSPGGTLLASAGCLHGFVQQHDVAARRVLDVSPLPFAGTTLAFAADGEHLLLGGHDTIAMWHLPTAEFVAEWDGHGSSTRGLAPDASARVVYFGDGNGTVRGWDLDACEEILHVAGHRAPVTSTALRPDGTLLLTGGLDGAVVLWRLARLGRGIHR